MFQDKVSILVVASDLFHQNTINYKLPDVVESDDETI